MITSSLHHISTIKPTFSGSESIRSKITLIFRERDKITARALRLTSYNLKLSRGEKRRVEAKLCGLLWMLRSWQPAIIQFQGNVSNASKTESCRSPPAYRVQMFLWSESSREEDVDTVLSEVGPWTSLSCSWNSAREPKFNGNWHQISDCSAFISQCSLYVQIYERCC